MAEEKEYRRLETIAKAHSSQGQGLGEGEMGKE